MVEMRDRFFSWSMDVFSNAVILTSEESFTEKEKSQIHAFLTIPSLHREMFIPSFSYLQHNPPKCMAVHLGILQ